MKKEWRDGLKKLPHWMNNAIAKHGSNLDYIAYSLSQNVYDLLIVKDEIENALPGSRVETSPFQYDANEQRACFFYEAMGFADYFRPTSPDIAKRIPPGFSHNLNPSACKDFAHKTNLLKQIGELSGNLKNLLHHYDQFSKKLSTPQIDCDPFHLIYTSKLKTQYQPNSYHWLDTFEQLMVERSPSKNPAQDLSSFLMRLEEVIEESTRSVISDDIKLGINSRKSSQHFYEAFNNWLSDNTEETGGFLPAGFHLSDNCWAILISSLTYNIVDAKAVGMLRSRATARIKNQGEIPLSSIDFFKKM